MKIIFKAESFSFIVALNKSNTAKEILEKLPFESNISIWGEEIYFNINFKASAEEASMEVGIGDVVYWPQGKCLCVFFGPTPASTTQMPVPASPVVIIGKTQAKKEGLKSIQLGEKISVELYKE